MRGQCDAGPTVTFPAIQHKRHGSAFRHNPTQLHPPDAGPNPIYGLTQAMSICAWAWPVRMVCKG